MNQSQFLASTCNSLEARERSRVHGSIGFGFASHWLKNWRESFKPITKRSNRIHGITFDSHLKIALLVKITWLYLYQCHLNWKCEMKASLQSPDQKKCISKWKRKGFLYIIQSVFLSIPFFFLIGFFCLLFR